MTPDDWAQVKSNRRAWQEADLHDLRARFAALLLAIRQHQRAVQSNDEWQVCGADRDLWDELRREGF